MRYLFIVVIIFLSAQSRAQEQDVKSLRQAALDFQKKGDFNNAVIMLNRALQQEPSNTEMQRDLAFALYSKNDLNKALEMLKPLLEKKEAGIQVYQLAGKIYKSKDDLYEGDKLYRKGVKKFPLSGALYNDYGELLWTKRDNAAINQWEKGIETDPNFPLNYYNAAKFHYNAGDKAWCVLYAEIFVNMEKYSRRTIEIKNLLLEAYKKLLIDTNLLKNQNTRNQFSLAYLTTIARAKSVTSAALTPESLTFLRTRFILDWDEKYATRFPYRLFDYHRQLLKDGLFEAYNQWLFGPIQNLTAFQVWTNKHSEQYGSFISFQNDHVFKLSPGQSYLTVQNKKD